MAAEHERDKWLERLLRRRPAGSAATPSHVCLDAETLAAWADRSLTAKELAAAEIHASNCPRCMALLAAIGRTTPPPAVDSRSTRGLFRWLVPLAAAATAVAIWVAIPDQQRVTPPLPPEMATRRPTISTPTSEPTQMPAEPPAAPPRSALAPQPKSVEGQEGQRRASVDSLSARSRDEAQDAKKRENEIGATLADRAAQAPAAAPQSAARDTLSSKPTFRADPDAALERSALNETVIVAIEEASPNDSRIRWRSSSGVDIERSTDGGQTWTKTSSTPPAPIVAIQVKDALTATATTSDGRTFSTTDGGTNWTPVQEKPPAPF